MENKSWFSSSLIIQNHFQLKRFYLLPNRSVGRLQATGYVPRIYTALSTFSQRSAVKQTLSLQPCLSKVTRNSGVYFRAFIRTKADVKRRYYVHMSKSY